MSYTSPQNLEKWAFWWSEARLVIAAVALLLGGIPPILLIMPGVGLPLLLLKISWIVSGIAALYLGYRWFSGGQKIFGGKNMKDTVAFLVMVVSGLNLGIVGILGNNIGMSLLYGRIVFAITAVVYLLAAWHLYQRSVKHGGRLF